MDEQNEIMNVTEETALANANEMTFEQRKGALNAITNFASIWDLLKETAAVTVDVVNVLQLPIEQTDKRTGEVREAVRCIFVAADGKSYATSSESVKNTADIMLAVLGEPAGWESAVTCIFRKEESKNGNPFINLSF